MMRKENYLSSEGGVILVATAIVGLVALYVIFYVGTLAGDSYYGSKYSRIEDEREKAALPMRLKYIEQRPELDEWVKGWIRSGVAFRGFTEEQVRIAKNMWGEPEIKEDPDLLFKADKVLIFNEGAEIKFYGRKSYYFIRKGIAIEHYSLFTKQELSKEDEKNLIEEYKKGIKRDDYLQSHPKLDRDLYWEIKAGIGEIGLNKEQIIVVWGEPSEIVKEGKDLQRKIYDYKDTKTKEINKGWSEFQADELWIYRNEKRKIYKKLYFKEDIVIESGHIK